MTWLGYIRVSTDKQADSGLGLAAQRAKLEAWAAFTGVDLVIIEDAGVSGSTLDRHGRRRVEEALSRGHFYRTSDGVMLPGAQRTEGVVVMKLDRVSRSLRDLLGLIDRHFCGRDAPGFVSCSEAIDTTTPIGRFVLTIFGALAQLEREITAERTRDAMQAAKAQGRLVGRVPVGMRRIEEGSSELEPDPIQVVAWEETKRGMLRTWRDRTDWVNGQGLRRADGSEWTPRSIQRLWATADAQGWS